MNIAVFFESEFRYIYVFCTICIYVGFLSSGWCYFPSLILYSTFSLLYWVVHGCLLWIWCWRKEMQMCHYCGRISAILWGVCVWMEVCRIGLFPFSKETFYEKKKRAKLSHMMKSRIDFLSVCVKMMDLVQIILGGGIRV